jgi:hypothetical protein
MASISRFRRAKDIIQAYFSTLDKRVYSHKDISDIFYKKKQEWELPEKMYARDFIEQLEKYLDLKKLEISAVGTQHYTKDNLIKYVFGEISPFEAALCIRANTHLSHYSSMFLMGLTEQLPKTIYVTFEQTEKSDRSTTTISQDAIDSAFSNPQREPAHYYEYLDYKIILLNSKFSKKAGVIRHNSIFGKNLPVTGIERTLIDIVVRPAYSGGVTEVFKAYERASEMASVNKLLSILSKLDYLYPYHQAIGFYIQKTGRYRTNQIQLLKDKGTPYKFYLTYNMTSKEYSREWHLYYPKNF